MALTPGELGILIVALVAVVFMAMIVTTGRS